MENNELTNPIVTKRDGSLQEFEIRRITKALEAALMESSLDAPDKKFSKTSVDYMNIELARLYATIIYREIRMTRVEKISVDQIQLYCISILRMYSPKAALAYISYSTERNIQRLK